MGAIVAFAVPSELDTFAESIESMVDAAVSLQRGTTTPADFLPTGCIWNKSNYAWAGGDADALLRWNGSSNVLFADPRSAQINAGGTVPMGANLAMGSGSDYWKITHMAPGTTSGDAVAFQQAMIIVDDGGGVFHWNAANAKISSLGAPEASDDAARLVDTQKDNNGLFAMLTSVSVALTAQVTDPTADTATSNPCLGGKNNSFTPRVVRLFAPAGAAITLAAGGASVGSLTSAMEFDFNRWDSAANPRVGPGQAWTSGGGGSGTVTFEVRFKFGSGGDATRGFWVRVKRVSDGALCVVAGLQAMAMSGI